MAQIMTDDRDIASFGTPAEAAERARERITQIGVLFNEMAALTDRWMAEAGPADFATGKKILAKLGELQTAHLMMLRAEEAFHDKFSPSASDEGVNHDDVRDEIGRRLDRIRDARDAE